ncbi:membrane-associated progesterone receptor component 1 [Drosophila santomea]|uniref:membrane-associated progesterone receptor component 1 n=1 Tax=Drosophila santomea TaxID=129105 RepID=UPI0019531FCE|nr:membrane-associated progesterone receptor component 1 [Drosophila santomea]
MVDNSKAVEHVTSWYSSLYNSIKQTPINVTLLIISTIVFYKVASISRRLSRHRKDRDQAKAPGAADFCEDDGQEKADVDLPPLRQDFTVPELREYDGTRADGRILVAVNFNIYDVSRSEHYYGRNGVNPNYAGRDISRHLINLPVNLNASEDFDDLSDLSNGQMNTLREWEQQYNEKYPFVGKLKEEPHINYTNEADLELDTADYI